MENTLQALLRHCNRCQHDWLLRNPIKQPRTCPACNSPYWDKERVVDRPATKQAAPRPRQYGEDGKLLHADAHGRPMRVPPKRKYKRKEVKSA